MTLEAYREEIKRNITGGVLKLSIDDATVDGIINSALREIQRYIDTTKLVTIPYTPCIDMKEYNVNSVSRVYRAEGWGVGESETPDGDSSYDPMYMGMWQMMSGNGNLYNISDWSLNFAAWNTALQIRNTLSTDLAYRYDKSSDKLYINCGYDHPDKITIEYIPRFNDVAEIVSDFWIDMLMKLATAEVKIVEGRVRKRYTQSNALWSQDVDIYTEGVEELNNLRQQLKDASYLQYPVD